MYFYLMAFGGDTSMINDWIAAGEDAPPPEKKTIEQNGMIYKAGYGRWAEWEGFDRYVHTLFTDTCWTALNERSGVPVYIEYDGRMYYLDAAMGNSEYNANFPDEYRVKRQSDEAVEFTVIGHYSDPFLRDGETAEERDLRLADGYDYILEFPIQIVLTTDGWRLNRFASPRSIPDANAAK